MRIPARSVLSLVSAPVLAGLAACASTVERYEYEEPKMGTRFKLVFYADGDRLAESVRAEAFRRIDELEAIFSDYDPASEVSRLASVAPGKPVTVSPELYAVLAAAQDVAARSDGAFDVTVGPYTRLWRRAQRQEELPAEARLVEAAASVGWRNLKLDPIARTVTLGVTGMRLDLGGIAKGFTLDEVLRVLAEHGVERALVDGGGDVLTGEPPPDAAGWVVAVESEDPSADATLMISNAAVATSGGSMRYVDVGDRRYSHIVDPRTGYGVTRRVSATVIARDGTSADAAASALSVLGRRDGLARFPDVIARIVTVEGGRTEVWDTAPFARYLSF